MHAVLERRLQIEVEQPRPNGLQVESSFSKSRATQVMDLSAIEQAVRTILEAVGEDPDRDGLLETPRRVARMMPKATPTALPSESPRWADRQTGF